MVGEEEGGEPRRGEQLTDAAGRSLAAGARGAVAAGQATGRGVTALFRFARRAARAEGAGDSGLSRLIELHAFNAAGDAAIAISLAGTLFFANPGEARGQVALFLGLTMLPFAVVAPLIGPFLDRFSHGRRWAIGASMALRAFLAWLMADAVASQSVLMYPTALGCLVASKAYGVTRAATVPRLLPSELTLVKANSRISLAGVVGAAVSAPMAGLASTFGSQWTLRYAFVVFAGATILAILLPAAADASAGEQEVSLRRRRSRLQLPAAVVFALRCNAGLRMVSGFLTMYLAFLLRQHPLPGWEHRTTLLMGLVVGAAGLGNTVGIAVASVLRRLNPATVVVVALVADSVAAVLAALFYGLVAAMVLGLTAGVAQAMGKLSLDATVQRDVPESHRTSAFARSETLLQLSWVVGGFIGIGVPLEINGHVLPKLGLGLLAGLIVVWTVFVLARRSEPRPTGLATAAPD
ncbi:MFS transporter [Nocardioides pocheonensis]|uniref:MFS transporter n=1 Tax=Nocardioides pocheonensis TaxID=661485 RepID=A0A3N0GZG1_9ACTN|nr:MFS transporter [Nocardioides pocheonensis]RNM17498.1 MFS transporter [Nocardioides pocheonensis]